MRDSAAESDDAEVVKRNQRDRQRRKQEGGRHKRRVRRSSEQGDGNDGDEMAWARPGDEMAWARPGEHAARNSLSREVNVRRQASRERRHPRNRQSSSPPKTSGPIDELVRGGQVRDTSNSDNRQRSAGITKLKCKHVKTKRSSKITPISSDNNDIDGIISLYGDMCDLHMATLLELKNSIASIEYEVKVSSKKDKEFQQVRGWYSALVEKHTKLQKDHQKLQEEHLALQEKYLSLKHESSRNDSFLKIDFSTKETKKKEKSSLGDVVWQRAGKM